MATDWPNDAQTPLPRQVDALRQRGVLSPRSIRRMQGPIQARDRVGGFEGVAGQAERSASDAGWLHEPRRPSEVGADYQQLAAAHDADDATERAFNRYQSLQYKYDLTTTDGKRLGRDEGSIRNRGEVPFNEIDHPTNQGGSARHGRRMSAGGSAGREAGQSWDAIDGNRNSRTWAPGSELNSGNRNTRLRDGEHWLAHYATRAQARPKQSNEYYEREDGTLSGDPGWRQS